MPRRPVSLGRAVTPRCSRAVRCSLASTSTSSHVVVPPGSRSISAYVGSCGRSTREVQACHSSAPKFAAQTSAAGSSTTRYVCVSPGSASGFVQRGSHSGAWSGSSFCQNPLRCAPFGYRCMFSARWVRYGRTVGAICAAYRSRSRLVTGSSPERAGNSSLVRLVPRPPARGGGTRFLGWLVPLAPPPNPCPAAARPPPVRWRDSLGAAGGGGGLARSRGGGGGRARPPQPLRVGLHLVVGAPG